MRERTRFEHELKDLRVEREAFSFLDLLSGRAGSATPAPPEAIPAVGFTPANRAALGVFLGRAALRRAVAANSRVLGQSAVTAAELRKALARYVDFQSIADAVRRPISSDEVLAEAVHQFQLKCYVESGERDGIAGERVMDDVAVRLNRSYPRRQRRNNQPRARAVLGAASAGVAANAYGATSTTWWDHMMNPSFLGFPTMGYRGIHRELVLSLRRAERSLLGQAAFRGRTPVEIARLVGLNERHRGHRPNNTNRSMHVFGCAIDVSYFGNPWIRGSTFTQILGTALGRTRSQVVPWSKAGIGHTLHSLGTAGLTTAQIYAELVRWNEALVTHLRGNPRAVAQLRGEPVFVSGRNPLKGFIDLHQDLVVALRDHACLAWGAVDFGPNASGDIMHFDTRTFGPGRAIAGAPGAPRPFLPPTRSC